MSQAELLHTMHTAKGNTVEIWTDKSQPLDSIERKWSVTVYDGQPGSILLKVPPHWHKHHDEHMTILEGEAEFIVEGVSRILKKGDQTVVPRWKVHAINCIEGKPLRWKEATNPTGDFKEDFFLDVFSGGYPTGFWHLHRAFWDGDAYVALPFGSKIVDQAYMFVVGGIAKLIQPRKKPLEEMRKDLTDSNSSTAAATGS